MFTITFEVETLDDLQNQVNQICDGKLTDPSTVRQIAEKIDADKALDNIFESDSAPVPTPAAPVQTPKPEQPVVSEQPAPAVKAEVQSPAPSNSEVDSDGVPWDGRIHASTKSKVKAGTWKKKKGVDQDYYMQVMKEISSNVQPEPVAPTPAPPVASPQPVATPAEQFGPPPSNESVQQAASAYTPAPIPQGTKPAHSFETFNRNFIQVVAMLKQENKITQEYIDSLNNHFGLDQFWDIASHPDKMRELFENFCQFGFITKVD